MGTDHRNMQRRPRFSDIFTDEKKLRSLKQRKRVGVSCFSSYIRIVRQIERDEGHLHIQIRSAPRLPFLIPFFLLYLSFFSLKIRRLPFSHHRAQPQSCLVLHNQRKGKFIVTSRVHPLRSSFASSFFPSDYFCIKLVNK